MTEAQSAAISPFLKVVPVEVRHADTPYIFDIQVTVFHGPDSACLLYTSKLILQSCLRSGDPFTQIGAGQYWVLLPGAGSETHSACLLYTSRCV